MSKIFPIQREDAPQTHSDIWQAGSEQWWNGPEHARPASRLAVGIVVTLGMAVLLLCCWGLYQLVWWAVR